MATYFDFRLMNKTTGGKFSLYATTLTEARNIACNVNGGDAEDWIEVVPCF